MAEFGLVPIDRSITQRPGAGRETCQREQADESRAPSARELRQAIQTVPERCPQGARRTSDQLPEASNDRANPALQGHQ